jgi:hypothetical protein
MGQVLLKISVPLLVERKVLPSLRLRVISKKTRRDQNLFHPPVL